MKKSIYFILCLLCIMSINITSVFAKSSSIKDILPGKPSLLNTKYAESFNELTIEQRKNVNENDWYKHEDENGIHNIMPINGRMGNCTFDSEVVMRAELNFENSEFELAEKLSSDNILHFLFLDLKTYCTIDDYPEAKDPGLNRYFVCLYGDKAEQWFSYGGSNVLPPKELAKNSNKFIDYGAVVKSDDIRGCTTYYPIVCVRESYVDRHELDDYMPLNIYIYYEDEDWLIPDKLQFKWEGLDETVDIDDFKATSNFKQSFVESFGVTNANRESERRTKFEAIYDSVEYYDPFSDENYEEKKKAENEKKDAEIKDEKEQEKEDKQEEVEKIPEEKTEPEKEHEPEIKEPEPIEPTEQTEKTEPEEDNQEENVAVYLNGELLNFEQAPVVEQDRVLVPMRKIFEAMEAKVEWQQEDKTVFAEKNGRKVKLQIGNAILEKDGEQIELDCLPQLVNDNTMIPIRAVAEALDANVVWNEASKAVVIEEK